MTGIIMRGGSWISDPDSLRSALRLRFNPDYRGYGLGFRLILRKLT